MKILVVAMQNSIHTARWLEQFDGDDDIQIALFPSIIGSPKHSIALWGRIFSPLGFTARYFKRAIVMHVPINSLNILFHMFLQDRFSERWRAKWLEKTIRKLKPDIIHSLEFQHAGYVCLEVKKRMGKNFPTWIATNWGSDIYLYARLKGHAEPIKGILQQADFYSAECERDYKLAQSMEMTAQPLPVIPNSGGFHLDTLEHMRSAIKTSQRKIILIKGYQMVFGRAMTAIKALELIADELKSRNYEIYIVPATEDMPVAIELMALKTGLNIHVSTVHTPLSHEEMLRLHASARIHVGVSISDGISTSMLEAMALGAFPIQTCTSCANEWIEHGKTGFIAQSYEDPQEIAALIMRSIEDDELVDLAAEANWKTISTRACYESVRGVARSFYDMTCPP